MLKSLAAAACTSAVLLTLLPAVASATVADQTTQVRVTTCDRNTYVSKVRTVKGLQSIGISRMWVHTYPGRTTIQQGETVETDHKVTLTASVSTTVGASLGAGAMLKKVVNVFAEVHGDTTYTGSISSTKSETKVVTSQTTTHIPAGRTVVWFVGHKTVKGSFQYSACDYAPDEPRDTGHVNWHSSRWSSFSIREDGGQRCDFTGNTSVARAAKRIGCS
ncbi:hypothetical protein [Nocardioides sp.]|uniref:hypothetical protein n=1 Tax=Nocardioides sp. TaxID=35761 RepID=UPI0031FEE4AC|nr:hypothetical protein [Nocardioides sp.]